MKENGFRHLELLACCTCVWLRIVYVYGCVCLMSLRMCHSWIPLLLPSFCPASLQSRGTRDGQHGKENERKQRSDRHQHFRWVFRPYAELGRVWWTPILIEFDKKLQHVGLVKNPNRPQYVAIRECLWSRAKAYNWLWRKLGSSG